MVLLSVGNLTLNFQRDSRNSRSEEYFGSCDKYVNGICSISLKSSHCVRCMSLLDFRRQHLKCSRLSCVLCLCVNRRTLNGRNYISIEGPENKTAGKSMRMDVYTLKYDVNLGAGMP